MQDAGGVAAVSIHHRTHGTELDGAGAHEFAPKRVGGRGTGADVNFVALQVVQGLKHQAEGTLEDRVGAPCVVFAEDIRLQHRHGAAYRDHVLAKRLDFGREKLFEQSHLVHHVSNHGGEEFMAAEGEEIIVGIPKWHGDRRRLRTGRWHKESASATNFGSNFGLRSQAHRGGGFQPPCPP